MGRYVEMWRDTAGYVGFRHRFQVPFTALFHMKERLLGARTPAACCWLIAVILSSSRSHGRSAQPQEGVQEEAQEAQAHMSTSREHTRDHEQRGT